MKISRLIVMLVVLASCCPSFGYVIVYKMSCNLRAVDTEPNALVRVMMRGYLLIDVNDSDGSANEAYWVSYGRDHEGNLVYDTAVPYVELTTEGRYQIAQISFGEEYSITAVGKTTSKAIGLADHMNISTSMSGNCLIQDGIVYNLDQLLTGSGSVVLMWDSVKTRAANTISATIDDVFDNIVTALEAGGYETL